MRVVRYTRVSTEDQASSGLGLAAQREVITRESERRDWTIEWVSDAGFSAKSLQRPGVSRSLELLKSRQAEALVVSRLDRLSRPIHDFAGLMDRGKREGWALVCLDLGVDTTTPTGTLMANVFASFAQFERELIGQRTSEALQVLRRSGVRLGRPSQLPEEVLWRISRARDQGSTLREIAERLEADGVRTATGQSRWWSSTVRAAVQTFVLNHEAQALQAEVS